MGNSSSTLHTQAYRTAGNADRFKIVAMQNYSLRTGYRQWAKGATATTAPTFSGDSAVLTIKFDGAASTLLGFSAIAYGVLFSMF